MRLRFDGFLRCVLTLPVLFLRELLPLVPVRVHIRRCGTVLLLPTTLPPISDRGCGSGSHIGCRLPSISLVQSSGSSVRAHFRLHFLLPATFFALEQCR